MILTWMSMGCRSDPPPAQETGAARGDLEVVLGTGTDAFEPLLDGDEVEVTHGGVGGWWLWTSFRVSGAEANVQWTSVGTLRDPSAINVVCPTASFLALIGYDPETGEGSTWGQRAQVLWFDPDALQGFCDAGFGPACAGDGQTFVCGLAGLTLDFSLTVTDLVDGRSGTASVPIVLVQDPLDDCP